MLNGVLHRNWIIYKQLQGLGRNTTNSDLHKRSSLQIKAEGAFKKKFQGAKCKPN